MRTKVEILPGEQRPDLALEPFFRNREEARLIDLLRSVPSRRKYAIYFERHGCYKCGRRDVPHAAHAHCAKCYSRERGVFMRIEAEIKNGDI
ncbi:MAG: hypothetical protein WB780_11730 [Candidatus Acidiferrales bacterium]